MDRHIVYAVVSIDTDIERVHIRKRVSRATDWNSAIDRWYKLDDHRRAEGTNLRTLGVSHYAVRAENDPEWPARKRAQFKPRCAKTGRFV